MNKAMTMVLAALAAFAGLSEDVRTDPAGNVYARFGSLDRWNSFVATNVVEGLPRSGGDMTGPLNMGFNPITFNGSTNASEWALWDMLRVWPTGAEGPVSLPFFITNAIAREVGGVLDDHVSDTDNPHGVTSEQVGAVPFVVDSYGVKTAVTIGSRSGIVGPYSLANGADVTASGNYSHAEGRETTASGIFSHAEGYSTTASGAYSHAEGSRTTASGLGSHVDGVKSQTKTDDIYAYAWNGDETVEKSYYSHGPGTFNINPVGGSDGFYIGEQTLSSVISGAVSGKADKTNVYTKAELDAKGYVTAAVTNGLATAESVDGIAADVAGKADAAAVYAKDEADARFYPADEGALWASWWSGDGFRVAVSNYDVAASSASWDRLPSASFDYRPGGTGALVRVWSETTRWERHRAEAAAFSNAVDMALAGKAGLDWGRTTPTGFDAPEGFTWLDTPAVAVAGGLAWQRTVTSEGAVWLLCSNGMVAEVGGATNGSFRVVDMATGEPAFEVVQGERRTVGANCGEVYTWKAEDGKTHMRVVYNVASDDPPVLHVADELKPQGGTVWHDEGAEGCPALFAGWTGSSGAWTNALWRASDPAAGARDALFCFATYETGGETVVKNRAPVSMSKIVVGGVTYTIGTATVGGHTVLTLTEAK